jgi:D-3-phosphoglycerate dehydrogenase
MKILAVGDSYMPPRYFEQAFAAFDGSHDVEYFQVHDAPGFQPRTLSERRLREYQGSPSELVERMADVEVLVVQGAPVTDEVLDASSRLVLVCCARGGPVNVDLDALAARHLPLVNAPGRNAEAVADLTIALLVMLARGLPKALAFVAAGNQVRDNWEGARFMGSDLRRHTLGLVGFGEVGSRVARRASAFGMELIVFDPYVKVEDVSQCRTLDELLTGADFISLHARATDENANLIDAAAFEQMKPGSYLVNTARETLVDEDALDDALASGHLAGAALDVFKAGETQQPHRLLRHSNVVITPHLGGATHETLLAGAVMIAEEIDRFAAGRPLVHLLPTSSSVA